MPSLDPKEKQAFILHIYCTESKKQKVNRTVTLEDRINCYGVCSGEHQQKMLFKGIENGILKKKLSLGVEESFICCYNQQMPFIKSKMGMGGGAQTRIYWSKLTSTRSSLKRKEGGRLYPTTQVPTRQCQNDLYFFACFVIIPRGGVTGLLALGFFFSAGFRI